MWAFGCVLYEMLSGRQSFGASDVTESLAAVISLQPKWDALPANLHPRLREVVERCMKKSVAMRYQDIGDVRLDIEEILAHPSGVFVQPVAEVVSGQTAIETAVGGGHRSRDDYCRSWQTGTWKPTPPSQPLPVSRFVHVLPEGERFTRTIGPLLAVSPDGTKIAYVANQQLYLRNLGELEAKAHSGGRRSDIAILLAEWGVGWLLVVRGWPVKENSCSGVESPSL